MASLTVELFGVRSVPRFYWSAERLFTSCFKSFEMLQRRGNYAIVKRGASSGFQRSLVSLEHLSRRNYASLG